MRTPVRSFHDFVGNKNREKKRQLFILKKVLEQGGFKIESYFDSMTEPYIYCYNSDKNTTFKGVRLYKIGDKIAYRVQRESTTHPFGAAYLLDVDEIFNDLMGEGISKEKLGHKVIEEIIKVIRTFFKESAEAEKKEDDWSDDEGALGAVHIRNSLGGDYSSQVHDMNRP